MKLVNSGQMRRIDADTIKNEKIASVDLMENAGYAIASAIISEIIPTDDEVSFSIFCGKGNNGGDGFVIGRFLQQAGLNVKFYFLGPLAKLTDDARINFDRVAGLEIPISELKKIEQLPEYLESDFIIDALFGTGFEGSPKGISADLIEYINNQPQQVISVDLPSGLNADNGQFDGAVIDADFTFTLALPKYGLYISPGREKSGIVNIIDIGIPDKVIDKFKQHNQLITPEYVSDTLPIRKPDGHKGDFGKLFILAGSTGMTGAVALTAKSALRSGVGLAKIGCPKSIQNVIAQLVIEATSKPLPDIAKKGALALRGLGEIKLAFSEHDAVVIGPGIGQHFQTKELICRLLLGLDKPAVIDADGLNALVGNLQILEDTKAELILTPHPGEFQRLTGVHSSNDIFEKIESARKFAIKQQTVLVLKGSPTVVADINGTVFLNQTGNSGMATGGSGDVLSGIIGCFLSQGVPPIDAALCGVYLHGLAGDFAAAELGMSSMIASDIIDFLPEAFLSSE